MEDICNYEIQIRGLVEADDINVASPLRLTVAQATDKMTRFIARTDQSGLVGLIRHLHGLGFELLSIRNVSIDEPELSSRA